MLHSLMLVNQFLVIHFHQNILIYNSLIQMQDFILRILVMLLTQQLSLNNHHFNKIMHFISNFFQEYYMS